MNFMGDQYPEPDLDRLESLKKVVAGVKPPLSRDIVGMAAMGMGYIEHMTLQGKQPMPQVSFMKNGKIGLLATEFLDKCPGDMDKEQFAAVIRNLRNDCEIVVFGHEAWMTMLKKEEYERGDCPRPRDDPKRKEAGLVQVWSKGRHLMFLSEISRNPTRFDTWKLNYDSADAQDKEKPEGRFT